MSDQEQYQLKTGKCWQSKSVGIIWQVICHHLKEGDNNKFFLNCKIVSDKPIVEILTNRPKEISGTATFASLSRKYLTSARITKIYWNPHTFAYLIPFDRGQAGSFWIQLTAGKQAHMELIDPKGCSLVRFSEQGTYTHKKNTELPQRELLLMQGWQNILDTLIKTYQTKPAQNESDAQIPASDVALVSEFSVLQREARKRIARRLKTVRVAIEKTRKSLPTPKDLELIQLKARMLQSFAHRVKPDWVELKIEPHESGLSHVLEIELDPEKTIGNQIEQLFIDLKKQRKSLELGRVRLQKEESELRELEMAHTMLNSKTCSDDEIYDILKKLGMPTDKQKSLPNALEKTSLPYRVFKSSDGCEILVGKNPSDNDLLAKSARSNDYWFHVVGSTGSHVVVPYKSLGKTKEISEIAKKEAAILTIHFSKLRGDCAGEIYFTKKQHIKKKKGMPAGLWLVEKSDNFFIRYTDQELKILLNRLEN